MKLFIYEYITSGALIDKPLPPSLAREGNDMLAAIVQDLSQLAITIELIILRDARLDPLPIMTNNSIYTIHNARAFTKAYHDAMHEADMVLPIAPETDGILTKIQQDIIESNTRLLASDSAASKICSDKYLCHQKLNVDGLHSPTTIKASEWSRNKFNSPTGFIIKPQDGAGCIDTYFMADDSSLETWLASPSNKRNNMIIQPYIEGLNISLSVLSDFTDSRVLAINTQNIKRNDDKLSFLGSTVNGVNEDDFSLIQASTITDKIHHAIAGLWGFIGIDLILQKDKVFIIDINPRLTTSYIGLNESLGLNPAELLFIMMNHGVSALPKHIQQDAIEVKA